MSDENYVCAYHNLLAANCLTDETVLALSNLTRRTATSSFITGAFDFIKNFVSQNTMVTGADGIKSLMSSYCFCIRSTSADV